MAGPLPSMGEVLFLMSELPLYQKKNEVVAARVASEEGTASNIVQPAPAPHPAHPSGRAAFRIVLVTVARVSCSCEQFSVGFELHLLPASHTGHTSNCIP